MKNSNTDLTKTDNQSIDFDNFLLNLIPHLSRSRFVSKKGTEGKVYFVGENFVVKSYKNLEIELADDFENYCNEISHFAKQGLNVPKIYSWKILKKRNGRFNGYILEERILGQRLYNYESFESSYDLFNDICSKHEFKKAVKTQNNLYHELVKKYFNYFISVNTKLAEFSDSEIESFLESDFIMRKSAVYGSVDVNYSNVLDSGKKLILIDNFFGRNDFIGNTESCKVGTLNDILILFDINTNLTNMLTNELRERQTSYIRLNNENIKVCSFGVKKFIKRLKVIVGEIDFKKSNEIIISNNMDKFMDEKTIEEIEKDLGLN